MAMVISRNTKASSYRGAESVNQVASHIVPVTKVGRRISSKVSLDQVGAFAAIFCNCRWPSRSADAPVKINPDNIRAFKDAESFYKWLGKHHDKEAEIWIKVTRWIQVQNRSLRRKPSTLSFAGGGSMASARFRRQELSPALHARSRKSIWSKINVDNVARLIKEGRMTDHGLREVDAAKARRALGARL